MKYSISGATSSKLAGDESATGSPTTMQVRFTIKTSPALESLASEFVLVTGGVATLGVDKLDLGIEMCGMNFDGSIESANPIYLLVNYARRAVFVAGGVDEDLESGVLFHVANSVDSYMVTPLRDDKKEMPCEVTSSEMLSKVIKSMTSPHAETYSSFLIDSTKANPFLRVQLVRESSSENWLQIGDVEAEYQLDGCHAVENMVEQATAEFARRVRDSSDALLAHIPRDPP